MTSEVYSLIRNLSYMENILGYKIAASWNVLPSPEPQTTFF